MTTYYKEAGNGEIIKLDDKGNKSPSFNKKNSPGLWKEMQVFIDAGGVVEPQFTPEEQEAKEALEDQQALESQKSTCIRNLNDTDYKLLEDFEYPEDVAKIKADRLEWKRIVKSDKLETVPENTFS